MFTKLVKTAPLVMLFALTGCGDKSDSSTEATDPDEKIVLKSDEEPKEEKKPEKKKMSGKGPYGVKSGMIEYQLEGMQSGTITKYWRNYGMEIAEYHDTSMNIMGMVQTEKKWTIFTPDGIYNIDQAKNTATRVDNPANEMMGNMNRDQMQSFGKEMLEQMGKRNGTMDIAGETCERWTMAGMGSDVCIWEGIDIYTSTDMAGMGMKRTAVKIDTGRVDDEHFEVPENIQVEDIGNVMDWQEQMKRAQEFMPN